SDLDDVFVYDNESEESETASVDHLSDGEEEVYDARTRKPNTASKKMFDASFLSDHCPIHDPTIKWKLMRHVLGEKYESPEQLERALVFYALANGYKLYYEVNNPRRLLAKCCRDEKDRKCPFSQAKRGKMKALQQYETCLEDHYGMSWSYASEIINSNPGLTWVKGSVENKDNWSWFMELLINDLGLVFGEGITIISDQHKVKIEAAKQGIIEAAKQVMHLAEHRQCARYIYANFSKKYTGVQYRNLFWKAAKATYPISTDKAYGAGKNGISVCFNAMIVDARRKPNINMLEDIIVLCMERLQKTREKDAKHWNVIPSGESRFEVRNGYEGFKVDERSRTCSCRGWQLSGIPCEHGIAAIYFLHKDPENYVSDWYNKDVFVNAYNHYIEGMNGMDQWHIADYQKPLPPIVRRMPGRPPHKRKRDVMEDDGNRTRIMSVTGDIVSASVRKVTTAGDIISASGGNVIASGGIMTTKGGNVTARGGKVSARGVSVRGGKVSARGGKVSARGGKVSATPSTPDSASIVVSSRGVAMQRLRPVSSRGRGDGSKSRMYPHGIRPIGFGVSWDPIDVKEITDAILKKYKCKVGISQARRGKMKSLEQYETCLEDHYEKLWSYAAEILNSNPGSTCKISVDSMPD
ncbi:transposase, MuDR, plant, partial [Tanacetum coccineum]